MPIDSLVLALIGHLVGDYLLQNDWMALNKKKQHPPCLVHCFIWALCVCGFAGFGWIAFLSLFAMHFAQDRTQIIAWWMKWNGQEQFMKPPCGPWSMIVVDNVWHVLQILIVWRFLAAPIGVGTFWIGVRF